MIRIIQIAIFLSFSIHTNAQLKGVQRPTYPQMQVLSATNSQTHGGVYGQSPIPRQTGSPGLHADDIIRQQQSKHTRAPNIMTAEKINAQYGSYANYVKSQNSQQVYAAKDKYRQQVYAILREESDVQRKEPEKAQYNGLFNFADPDAAAYKRNSGYYEKAANELKSMLDGEQPIDLKKAVYEMENVVLKDELSYQEFLEVFEQYKKQIKHIAKQEGLDLSDNLSANYAIQKLFEDTTTNYLTGEDVPPLSYDFKDIYGDENEAQPLVSKLMQTGKGQCRSMPLLYMMLAQELKAEAYISYSPKHSYVKFRDKQGNFYNYETTNGSMVNNRWIDGNGFVKVEAVRSKIYTDTVNEKMVVAQLLTELATTYQAEFGYDTFYAKCLAVSMQTYPNNIHNWLEQSNYTTARYDKAMWAIGYPDYRDLSAYPEHQELFDLMLAVYSHVDDMGFADMPEEAYEDWLKQLREKAQEQSSQEIKAVIRLEILKK